MEGMNQIGRRPTAVLAAMVVLVIVVGAWLTWFTSTGSQRVQHWSEVTQDMQTDVLHSHLALAERLAGDTEVDPQTDVVDPAVEAERHCEVMRDGGSTLGLDIDPMPALAPGGQFEALCGELQRFSALTEARASGSADQQEGTEADEAFDAAFTTMMNDLDGLDRQVNAIRRADEGTTSWVGYSIVVVLSVLLVGIILVGRRYGMNIAELARRNQVVLDAAGDGIYGVDVRGVGTFANPAVGKLTQREPVELSRMNAHDVLHGPGEGEGDTHTAQDCPLLRTVMDGVAASTREDVFVRADGSSYPAEYTASPVRDDPKTAGVIVFRNISERRAVETMKDQFVSMVSHELRTPLTSIHGSLGLLTGGALGDMPPSAQRMLEIATTNTDRLVRLINDILDIERMESGAVRMQREVVDAARLVEQAVASMRSMASQGAVELVVQSEPVTVWADPDRITQVLVNLVSNAVKFSPEGAVVTVSLTLRGDDALFTVRDHGRGIPADKVDSIFGRFQQVDVADSRDKGGTGLGLAISESIVTQHDGRIWVESELGKGSTFLVTIPTVRPRQAVATVDPVDLEQMLPPPRAAASRPTVLVVDDDPSVLEVVCTILERRDYRAVPASSGQEALARAAAEPPDAVVLDLVMPGTDGWEVLGALRASPPTADVPVVILSILSERDGSPPPETYEGWVPKPFDAESLAAVLERAIEGKAGQLRALVVEDDADLADVLTTTFRSHGVDTRHVGTVAAARSVVPDLAPDLIVLDLRLPDGDGVELLHTLRAQGHLGGVPVVVYTGYDIAPEDRSQLSEDGAIIFTKTRVSPEEFEQRVLQLVGAVVLPRTS
jgi:PAS domain S-box-containing protein